MGITPRSYSDDVYLAVKSKIIEGELDFGSRLHIRDLAEELGVSSTPVREALNRLSASGLAELTPHKGIFVVDPCEEDVKELCDARLGLELHMAEAVIRNATPQQIDKLRWLTTQPLDGLSASGLHDHCAQIAGNRVLQRLHSQVQGVLGVLFVKALRESKSDHYVVQHRQEEKQIVAAIEARDVARLRKAIKLHVENMEGFLLAAKVAKSDR
jgi:DNA-binding GntR family transcriptional regulator